MASDSYLLQETGFKIALEDGSGFIILEIAVPLLPVVGGNVYLGDEPLFGSTVADGEVYAISTRDSCVYPAHVSDEELFEALVSDSIA